MKAVLLSVLGFLVILDHVRGSDIYPSISWVPQNPLFSADGKNCNPGSRTLKVHLQSKVNFICPNTATVLKKSSVSVQTANMYENLWMLYNETAFKRCDASLDPDRRLILQCKTPSMLSYFPVLFAQHTAEQNGLKFDGGRWYYFIGTSDSTESHINDTHGGHCNDANNGINMKIAVYVCRKSNETYIDEQCLSDVGTLQCPEVPTNASSTTTCATQPSTTASTTASVSTEVTQNTALQLENKARRGEDEKDKALQKWKGVALAAIALISLLLVVALIMIYLKCGNRKSYCPYTVKRVEQSKGFSQGEKPERQLSFSGMNNRGFMSDKPGDEREKRFSSFYGTGKDSEEVDGSKPTITTSDYDDVMLPDKDKDVSIVIQNRDVCFDNNAEKGEDGNGNPPA